MTALYHKELLSMDRIVEVMSVNPSRLLGVEGGVLAEGMPADVTVINPEQEWTVHGEDLYTKALFTPFEGITLKGGPSHGGGR